MTIMKKVLSVLVLAFAAFHLALAGDFVTRDAKRLPLTARNFIYRYFTKPQIAHIKIETNLFGIEKYEVLLTTRVEIDFDSKGNWLEVDCKHSPVPQALVPGYAQDYVTTHFPEEIITKIERRRGGGVEVEMRNDYSLKFNSRGRFISMDD